MTAADLRQRLSDRRASESFTFEVGGLRFTATISRFPDGRIGDGPFKIFISRADEQTWLVTCRDHSWLHSDFLSAVAEASELACGFGVVTVLPPARQWR